MGTRARVCLQLPVWGFKSWGEVVLVLPGCSSLLWQVVRLLAYISDRDLLQSSTGQCLRASHVIQHTSNPR